MIGVIILFFLRTLKVLLNLKNFIQLIFILIFLTFFNPMRSKISTIYKHFSKRSTYSKSFLMFKPLLKSKFIDVNFRTLINAYGHSYFKIFPTRFKPFCLYTARSRGIISNYYFSRMTFKKFSMRGEIAGFRKSRW
jgi:ribosomal protein S14